MMYGGVAACVPELWMYIYAHQDYAILSFVVNEFHLRAFQHIILTSIILFIFIFLDL